MKDPVDIVVSEIVVSGKVASGKTTMALAILEHLKAQGFSNVSLLPELEEEESQQTAHLQSKRMEIMKDRPITIRTKQLPRASVPV